MNKVKPQEYLSKRGIKIFNEILSCINATILQSTDSFVLSVLANNFDLHHEMAAYLNENGVSQQTKTGYSQVRAEYTVYQKTGEYIAKHSGLFGLTPLDQRKIKDMVKEPELENPLTKLQKMMDISRKQ
jgi:phage terminase small subunit